jgi:hypothetical protein
VAHFLLPPEAILCFGVERTHTFGKGGSWEKTHGNKKMHTDLGAGTGRQFEGLSFEPCLSQKVMEKP